jgi:hypothetical protein
MGNFFKKSFTMTFNRRMWGREGLLEGLKYGKFKEAAALEDE